MSARDNRRAFWAGFFSVFSPVFLFGYVPRWLRGKR